MLKRLLLYFILLFFITNTLTFGQDQPGFPQDDDEFILQLQELLIEVDRQQSEKAQWVLDTFAAIYTDDSFFNDQKKVTIQNTLVLMRGLHLNAWPDFFTYLESIVKLYNLPYGKESFGAWHESFTPLITSATRHRLIRYWQKTFELFDKNIISSSASISWHLRKNNYIFSYEDGKTWISFSENDLVCYAQGDSTVIYNTSGRADFFAERFTGRGGKITWERVNLEPGEVHAILGNYSLNLSVARFEVDSVTFFNRHFFDEPLHGKLTERILADVKPEDANYPRFQSYQAFHEIVDLFPGIDFRGGFTMMGQRVIGSGTDNADATIKFYRSDSLFITARSRAFSIRPDRIITERSEISIYLAGDSIYHPAASMRYLHPNREFSIQRDEKGTSRAPFTNSFHRVDMYCEAIYWNIDTYEMELRMIRGLSETGSAVFESQNFFSELRYMRMQGISGLHPLIRLRNFANEYNSRTFPVSEYARYLRQDVGSVIAQVLSFSFFGFLSYDSDNQTVTLYDRLYHYITSYTGRSDFDVMQINSEARVNGRLNMNNFDLHLYGVERIPLSREKNVVIYPHEKELILKQNRDIYFHGHIESGLFDFYGKEFFFDYDMFKIDLVNTDSMSFRVRSHTPDSQGRYSYHRVQTVLEGINGELLVDHPRNKSGQMPYPRYPIFNSNNESYMFYDRESVQEGAYNREEVYLKLIPFTIDSLDNATTDNIAFDGVFISTGVFPDFYDYVTVQEDYSLGFSTETPEEGYPVWGGKAIYKGPIRMSNEGLRADGRLEFLNATVDAETMFMYPDSARARVNAFNLAELDGPVEHPSVKAMDVNMLFLPNEEIMSVKNTTRPFEMFDGLVTMEGTLNVSHDGLDGYGKLNLAGSELASDQISFNKDDFIADNSDIKLMTADGKRLAVSATSFDAKVDVAEQVSLFANIENQSKITFDIGEFDAYGFDWMWDMKGGNLQLKSIHHDEIAALSGMKPEEWIYYDFSGKEIISTRSARDSLSFYAGNLHYNLEENVIHADDVKIIKIADAAIYPHEGKVKINENATLDKLENSMILANTSSLLHRFYDAEVTVGSKNSYTAMGMYDYTDVMGNVQPVYFDFIRVDRQTGSTRATAEIAREMEFTISPEFGFNGKIELKAEKEFFEYNGAARIFADCPGYQPNSVRFHAEIKPDSVFIPLEEDLRNDANGSILTGIMLSGDSLKIYPGLFTRRRHYSDMEIVSATGYLAWEPGLRQYQVSSLEKLHNQQLPDDIITFDPNTCIIEGHGDLTLLEDLGQFKLTTYGKVTTDIKTNETLLDIIMGIDFFFLNSALGTVEENIRNKKEPIVDINLNRFKYSSFLHKRTDGPTAKALIDEHVHLGHFRRFPPELNHTFFFADLKMKWNEKSQSFHTTAPLGIGNMERFPINLYIDGFIELKKTRSSEDIFTMVLIPSGLASEGVGLDFYYYIYTNNILQTISSKPDYNDMIRSVKPRRRRMNVDRGERPFTYILASERRPFDFVRNMKLLND